MSSAGGEVEDPALPREQAARRRLWTYNFDEAVVGIAAARERIVLALIGYAPALVYDRHLSLTERHRLIEPGLER